MFSDYSKGKGKGPVTASYAKGGAVLSIGPSRFAKKRRGYDEGGEVEYDDPSGEDANAISGAMVGTDAPDSGPDDSPLPDTSGDTGDTGGDEPISGHLVGTDAPDSGPDDRPLDAAPEPKSEPEPKPETPEQPKQAAPPDESEPQKTPQAPKLKTPDESKGPAARPPGCPPCPPA